MGLRSFIILCVVAVVLPAFEVAHAAPAGAKSKPSIVSISDPTFHSCKSYIGKAEEPILANQNLCVALGKQNSNSLTGKPLV